MTRGARQSQIIWVIAWGLTVASVLLVAATRGTSVARASRLDVLRLDCAYYNPVSLVLRRLQWGEQEFAHDGTRAEWGLSLGSDKANEHTASGAVQFGSPAGRSGPRLRSDSRLLGLLGPLLRSLAETHG